jgi:hypothetical protein
VIALLWVAVLQAPLDTGTFVVRHDTVEVAREAFRLRGRATSGRDGWSLATTIRYDRDRPVIVLAPLLDLTADSVPLTLQFDVADPRDPVRILGQLGRGRFTVRIVARASERAREFPAPAAGRTVILDDSVYALYQIVAWFAARDPVSITAIVPRSGRRELLTIQDLGVAPTTLNRDPVSLRHLLLSGGLSQEVHLWLAPESGRLLRVDIPSRRVVVERTPSS